MNTYLIYRIEKVSEHIKKFKNKNSPTFKKLINDYAKMEMILKNKQTHYKEPPMADYTKASLIHDLNIRKVIYE